MKVGDLVRCSFQPRCGGYDHEIEKLLEMKYTIKDEIGILLEGRPDLNKNSSNKGGWIVIFPQFNYYKHYLSGNVLEVINENR